jgi:hypothetical protein
VIGEVKNRKNLLPGNGRVEIEKLVDRFSPFQEVDQALHWHTRIPKAGGATHALRANPNRLVEPGLLIGSHNFRISGVSIVPWICPKAKEPQGVAGGSQSRKGN